MRLSRPLLLTALLLAPTAARAQNLIPNDLALDTVQQGLNNPTAAEFLPDGRMVIIQQGGGIRVRPAGGGALINAGQIQVNVSGERGLLGLAVDPQFATSNRLYFYYSEGTNALDRHRVAWATIDANTSMVDVANRTVILRDLFGPANHNGGGIKFGPDGLLYVGVGDTGCNCGCAPGTNSRNYFPTCLSNANGKILRIGRDGEIPATNPLANVAMATACGSTGNVSQCQPQGVEPSAANTAAPRTEIYNWGFRNPWRFSFDEQRGHLWIGDVGEVTWEEITISTGPGQHHGWPYREGAAGDPVETCAQITPSSGNCVEPAYAYNHNGNSASVTGGVFSNHCSWPAPWAGRYWFSDYDSSLRRVWTLTPNAARDGVEPNSRVEVLTNAAGVVHFFNGPDGAIYLVAINDGEIWRVRPQAPEPCPEPDAGVVPADAEPVDADPAADAEPEPDATPGVDADPDADAQPAADAQPGLDASVAADASARADASAPGADAGSSGEEEDGCGCTAADAGSSTAGGVLLLAALSIARRRRR